MNSLQGRRGQAALQAGRQESRGLETWFSCLSWRFLHQGGGRTVQHIVLVGEEFTGLLAEINAQRSPKAKERGEVSGEREEER